MLTPLINSRGQQFGLSATIDNRPKPVRFDPATNRWVREGEEGYGGGNVGIPTPEPMDETAQLENFYRQQAMGQGNFVQRLTGDVPVGALDADPLINDRRFQKLYDFNPEKATELFRSTRGYTMEEAANREMFQPEIPAQGPPIPGGAFPTARGPVSARDLRLLAAQRSATLKKTPADQLREFEQFTGVNPIYANQDYQWSQTGGKMDDPSGYDQATGLLHIPGTPVLNRQTGEWEQKPSRSVPVPPQMIQRLRGNFQRWGGDFGGGGSGPQAVAPVAQQAPVPASGPLSMQELQEMNELKAKALHERLRQQAAQSRLQQFRQFATDDLR